MFFRKILLLPFPAHLICLHPLIDSDTTSDYSVRIYLVPVARFNAHNLMHAYSHPPSLETSWKVEVVLVVLEVFLCSLETHLTFLLLLIQYYLAAEHDFVFYRYPCLLLMLLID